MIAVTTVRRPRRATGAPRSLSAFAVSSKSDFKSGLKSIDRFLHLRLPAATQCLVEADDRQQSGKLRLPQRVFRLKQRQLGIEDGDDVGGSSLELLLGELKGTP
jgi:hypothetical protein